MRDVADADEWYAGHEQYPEQVALLRQIVLAHGLTETIKWKHPCYMDAGKNVAIVSARKDGGILSLLHGALVDDPLGRLQQPGQDRSGRYLVFASVAEIEANRAYIDGLLEQAIANERAGLRVPPLPDTIEPVDELAERMAADPAFRAAFEALTIGRQRQYNLHFGKAKKAATREARITAATERIFLGKGLTDCICGRSKHLPRCDGSHRRPAE
jgi:uncharacterized protein YdeI (YjbR/CyaY-like superfamily)